MNFFANPIHNPINQQHPAQPDIHQTIAEIKHFITLLENRLRAQEGLPQQQRPWVPNLTWIPRAQPQRDSQVFVQPHRGNPRNFATDHPTRRGARSADRNKNPCPSCQIRRKKVSMIATANGALATNTHYKIFFVVQQEGGKPKSLRTVRSHWSKILSSASSSFKGFTWKPQPKRGSQT